MRKHPATEAHDKTPSARTNDSQLRVDLCTHPVRIIHPHPLYRNTKLFDITHVRRETRHTRKKTRSENPEVLLQLIPREKPHRTGPKKPTTEVAKYRWLLTTQPLRTIFPTGKQPKRSVCSLETEIEQLSSSNHAHDPQAPASKPASQPASHPSSPPPPLLSPPP